MLWPFPITIASKNLELNNVLCFIYKGYNVSYIILATVVPTFISKFAVSC